nr:hypothetical protein [Paenibacillus sp. UNC451MF]
MSREYDKPCAQLMLLTISVQIEDAGDASGGIVVENAMHECLADDLYAGSFRFRQVRALARRLGVRRTACGTPAAVSTGWPSVVLDGVNGNGRRERLRSRLLRATGQHLCVPAETMRRHRKGIRFGRKRSTFAGDAEVSFHLGIVRCKILIADRPICSDAFQAVGTEILGMESRHHAEPGERSSAYTDTGLGHDLMLARIDPRLRPLDFGMVGFGVSEIHVWLIPLAGFDYGYGEALVRQLFGY